MGAKPWVDESTANVGPFAAETLIRSLTCKGLKRGSKVWLFAWASVQTDGTGTNPILRVRRGTIAGTVLESQTFNQAINLTIGQTLCTHDDDPNEDQDYSFTIQAGANVTVLVSTLKVEEAGP